MEPVLSENAVLSEQCERIRRSGFFDEAWYRSRYPDVAASAMNAAEHFLQQGASLGRDPGPGFATAWYLSQYSDVASSGMNPLLHFLLAGAAEGRLPQPNRATELDAQLWAQEHEAAPQLESLLHRGNPTERSLAAWSLARWFAFQGEWARAADLLRGFRALSPRYPLHMGPFLLGIEALICLDAWEEARLWLQEMLSMFPDAWDVYLAQMNLWQAQQRQGRKADAEADAERLACLSACYGRHGLAAVSLADKQQPLSLDNLSGSGPAVAEGVPLLSVIMPVFNAKRTLATAVRSILGQSYHNLELILVDDGSHDGSFELARALAAQDKRVRVLRQAENGGAYVARNAGLAVARGEFITTHDADDWSHPQKLELQVASLLADTRLMACTSHWVRCDDALVFGRWRVEEAWIYRNVSSLMFRREVFDTLGYWDRVTVNADTEYFYRIGRAFGWQALSEVLPAVPLAFGRMDAASLSQASATHLRTQFKGLRKDYHDAALAWHAAVADVQELYLAIAPHTRPFPAPAPMCRPPSSKEVSEQDVALVLASGLFDESWYCQRFPDVAESGLEPVVHYLKFGGYEGRDPSEAFSSSGYAYAYRDVQYSQMNPLLHYLRYGKTWGREALPVLPGRQTGVLLNRRVLLVAHWVGTELFGSERSFVDVLKALNELGLRVFVILPAALNAAYVDEVRAYAEEVQVLPYRWWHAARDTDAGILTHFETRIREWQIDLIHVNTIVLHEPLLAARNCGVPVLVHARELPEHDPALCEALGLGARGMQDKVLQQADGVIANSEVVARAFPAQRLWLVPNTVDLQSLDISNPVDPQHIRVALISSNLPKKGLDDFVTLATLLRDCPELGFVLIGPETSFSQALHERKARSELPNLELAAYCERVVDAVAQATIIVNLSQFQESFGRTVLEAMAARRPVVCYDWGALSDLVVHGETGYLVPFQDVAAVAERLRRLAAQPELIYSLGEAARSRVETQYGWLRFKACLLACYQTFFPELD